MVSYPKKKKEKSFLFCAFVMSHYVLNMMFTKRRMLCHLCFADIGKFSCFESIPVTFLSVLPMHMYISFTHTSLALYSKTFEILFLYIVFQCTYIFPSHIHFAYLVTKCWTCFSFQKIFIQRSRTNKIYTSGSHTNR